MRAWLIALLVAGCGSGADTRASAAGAATAPGASRPRGDAVGRDAAPAGDAPSAAPADAARADAERGGWASFPTNGRPIDEGLGLADGQPCAGSSSFGQAAECASGICEGLGCPDGKVGSNGWPALTGVCAPARRACRRDRRAYCGCDGKTFYASSNCPGRRFASEGACPAP